jgi:hypothetical protein
MWRLVFKYTYAQHFCSKEKKNTDSGFNFQEVRPEEFPSLRKNHFPLSMLITLIEMIIIFTAPSKEEKT